MKKVLLITMLLFSLFIITGCKRTKGYSELSYNELNDKINNKETFILMIESSLCSHCTELKKTIENINQKYKIDIKYIDIYFLTEEEIANIKNKFSYSGTPTVVNVIDGIEKNNQDRITGSKDYSYVKEKLIKWGYIKEG